MGNDFGVHHCSRSSALVHASNTMRAGPLTVRVTTSSRSDVRSTVDVFSSVASLTFVATIASLLPFQFLDHLVQLVKACVPELAVPRDPCRLILQSARAEPARPYAAAAWQQAGGRTPVGVPRTAWRGAEEGYRRVLLRSLASSSSSWSNVSGFQLIASDATASSRASFDGYRSWTTSSVRPRSSSKVAVVTTVPPSSSSLVH